MTVANNSILSGSAITFYISARLKDVRLLGLSARALFTSLGFGTLASYQLELAVTEAANNIIKYGIQAQPKASICLKFSVKDNTFICTFIDQGNPIEFLEKQSKAEKRVDVESFPVCKRGLCIIHQVMDTVSYTNVNGKNVLTLTKQIP